MGLKRGITGKEPNLSMGEKIASIEARSRSPEKLEISGKESVLQMDIFLLNHKGQLSILGSGVLKDVPLLVTFFPATNFCLNERFFS